MKLHHALCSICVGGASWLAAALPAQAEIHASTTQNVSTAADAKSYKMDAARYVYAAYPDKIYKGPLPPLLHAIVVLEVELDPSGHVKDVQMIRVPSHAPDVVTTVNNMIRQLSPMPAPLHLDGVKFTEIWLVDKSGRFQLDTLTEGQP